MRILIVGSDKIFAIENFYVKYLKTLGLEIYVYPAHSFFIDYYRNFFNKVLFKLGVSNIYNRINKQFKNEIEQLVPDLVWIFKGMEIFPRSLQWVKDRKIKLVNYNPDNPFLFSGQGSGNDNITNSIRIYDLHFTYDATIKAQLESKYRAEVFMLPFGFDVSDVLYDRCKSEKEIVKVCFLGNPDRKRAEFILALARMNIEIDVYGHDWEKFVNHGSITICKPVYGDEQWRVLRKYRIQLNLMRDHNRSSHNMRSFEIPAIGGVQLAPDTPDHRVFFQPDKEIFLFSNVPDCAQTILTLLALQTEEVNEIRDAARRRSIDSQYSYKNRSEQVYKVLKSRC